MPERSLIVRLLLLAGILLLLAAEPPDGATLSGNESVADAMAEPLPPDGDTGPDVAPAPPSSTGLVASGNPVVATERNAHPSADTARMAYWPHAPPA